MKIVIIGACSKIGMEYVKLLSKKENDLILIDNDKENLINIQNKYKNKVNMQIIASDIISESKIKELYIFIRKENPEFIINNLTFYNNDKFFELDEKKRYRYPYNVLLEAAGMNSKKNSKIGDLVENVAIAIEKEKYINQDIHDVKGVVSSNIASIIEGIIADRL